MGKNENLTDSELKTKKKKEKKPKKVLTKKQKIVKGCGLSLLVALIFVFFINVVFMPLSSDNKRVESINSYSGDNPFIVFDKQQQVAAHRAGAMLAPEETLLAFETSIANGSDIFEFDLHLTKDEQVVICHDHELDRTSNAVSYFGEEGIKINDKTLAELKELNFAENFETKDGKFPYRGKRGADIPDNCKIATLVEVLDYLKANNCLDRNYIIEIKDDGKNGKIIADFLMAKLKEYGIYDKVVFGTFKGDITKYVDENWPDLTRSASILEVLNFYYAFLYNTKPPVKCEVLQIPKGWGIYQFGSKAFIDYAHHYNIAVQYWTINDEETAKYLLDNGADAIITDDPELVYSVMGK